MRGRAFDPLRLDVAAFARDGAQLQGRWPLATLPRLSGSVEPGEPDTLVSWSAQGLLIATPGAGATVGLHLCGTATLSLQCQRCLQPVPLPLAVDTRFRFVSSEEAAARLDAELDDDVLVLSRDLDLRSLLEDELLLALPLVPRHESCPQPLLPETAKVPGESAPKPFAALAALRKQRDRE